MYLRVEERLIDSKKRKREEKRRKKENEIAEEKEKIVNIEIEKGSDRRSEKETK